MKRATFAWLLLTTLLIACLAHCAGSDALPSDGADGGADAPVTFPHPDAAAHDSSAPGPPPDATAEAGPTDAGIDAFDATPPPSFNVTAAASTSATRITVTFDAPPSAAAAATLANYSVPGLTLSGTPSLTGNTVSLITSAQLAISYAITVSGVARASDAQALTIAAATFTGRTPFNVASAASTNSVTMTVTFDAPPNPTQAGTLANYAVPGLTLSGTPSLVGSTVTLTTTTQSAISYAVTAANVTRASDGEPLTTTAAPFNGISTFNVADAVSTGNTQITVTFDDPPNAAQAGAVANYSVPGLSLSAPMLVGSTVTLTTSSQSAISYAVTVTGVARASDAAPLAVSTKPFTGRTAFNVVSAVATSATTFTVTFDAPPNVTQATTLARYAVGSLTLTGTPVLVGSTVTIATSTQSAIPYKVTVTGVARASDAEPLLLNTANFPGRAPFNVASAASLSSVGMTVTFDAPPNVAQATTLSSYAVAGLVLTGTPVLVGNVVTLTTSAQSGISYSVMVSGVGRASDGEPLTTNAASFPGTAVVTATVTNVVVTATSPNNATTPYNTGTVTTTITGTSFATALCSGVKLGDLDGIGIAANTAATTCTIDSDTQITATWPAGLRTNGGAGWDVLVTNSTSTANTTSAVKLVPVAGLLISEVYVGTSGLSDHEFVEVYNPTGTTIDTVALGLKMHTRGSTGTDAGKPLTAVTTGVIAPHKFLLIASVSSVTGEAWFANRDYTYTVSSGTLVASGGVYISLSATANVKVLDKVGWGIQPANGFEGTALLTDIAAGSSVERKPAGGLGHATDTDVNSADFNAPSTTITPRGTADLAQP